MNGNLSANDIEQAKKYLQNLSGLDSEITTLVMEYEKLKSAVYSLQAVRYDRQPVSGGEHKDLSDLIAMLDSRSKEIERKTDKWVDMRDEARYMIGRMPDAMERNILILRYITNLKWDVVMEKLNISRATSFRLHKNAIYNFAKYNKLRLFETIFCDIM